MKNDERSTARRIVLKKLNQLERFSKIHNISHEKFVQLAFNSHKIFREKKKKSYKKIKLLIFSLLICFVGVLFSLPSTRKVVYSVLRISIVKTYFIWEKLRLHENYSNSLKSKENFNLEKCGNLSSVEVYEENELDRVKEILNKGDPFIYEMDLTNWKAKEILNLNFLIDLTARHPSLFPTECLVGGWVNGKEVGSIGPSHLFLKAREAQNLHLPFIIFWENCSKKGVRKMRKLFQRPLFLPISMEMPLVHWLLLSTSHDPTSKIHIDLGTDLVWLVQLKGHAHISLSQSSSSSSLPCQSINITLQANHLLIWENRKWIVSLQGSLPFPLPSSTPPSNFFSSSSSPSSFNPLPSSSSINISLIFGAFFPKF